MRDPRLPAHARSMRSGESTPAQRILWTHLRRRPLGHRFRRREPIGPFIADFLSYSARLVVELDGTVHDSTHAALHDGARERWIATQGFTVLRFDNDDVCADLHWVLAEIDAAIGRSRA